jgi:hypothetical protein
MSNFLELLRAPPAPRRLAGGEVMGRVWGSDSWAASGQATAPAFGEAPADGVAYGRRDRSWVPTLELSGGQMSGFLSLYDEPTAPRHAATKNYVDSAVASGDLYQGVWAVAANEPPLDPLPDPVPHHGARWLCLTADPAASELPPPGMLGITGKQIFTGDFIIWDEPLAQWELLSMSGTGGLTKDLADTYYLSLNGGSVTGPITLPGAPGLAMQATTKNYVDTADNLRSLKTGDTFTGPLVLTPLQQTLPAHAATRGQVATAIDDITAEIDGRVLRTGDAMTGILELSGPPIGNLDAATKAYVDAADTARVLKAGDSMTGNLNMSAGAFVVLSSQPTANGHVTPKNYVDGQRDTRVAKTGDTMTGNLIVGAGTQGRVALEPSAGGGVTGSIQFHDPSGTRRGFLGYGGWSGLPANRLALYTETGWSWQATAQFYAPNVALSDARLLDTFRGRADVLLPDEDGTSHIDVAAALVAIVAKLTEIELAVSLMPRPHPFAGRGHG